MKPEEIWHRFENPEAPKVNHRLAGYHLHSIRFGKRMKKLSMVLRYSAGIRDLAEMNEHLIEQLHDCWKKTQESSRKAFRERQSAFT